MDYDNQNFAFHLLYYYHYTNGGMLWITFYKDSIFEYNNPADTLEPGYCILRNCKG